MGKYIYIYLHGQDRTSRGEEEEDLMLQLFSSPKVCTAHAVHKAMWYYSLAWLYSLSFFHVHVSLLITRIYCTSKHRMKNASPLAR